MIAEEQYCSVLNRKIETNPIKQQVRKDILFQQSHFISETGDATMAFTLPGEGCQYEWMLYDFCQDNGFPLFIRCAESKQELIESISNNLPPSSKIIHGELDQVISHDILNNPSAKFNFMWLDLVEAPTKLRIHQIVRYIQYLTRPKSLLYVTFWIQGRGNGGKQSIKDLIEYNHMLPTSCHEESSEGLSNRNIVDIIVENIMAEAKRCKIPAPTKIYDVIYGGGEQKKTTMVALGFSNGIRSKDPEFIPLIQEDRLVLERMFKVQQKKDKVRKNKVSEKDKVRSLLIKGWDNKMICAYCKISVPTLSAYKAHFNKEKKGLKWRNDPIPSMRLKDIEIVSGE